MRKVLFDCDNTMGIKDRDVDDGLALLYLLGRPDIDLVGITTTYGNSTIDVVYNNTRQMLAELGYNHIPLYRGAISKNDRVSPAAEFLVAMADQHPKAIDLLATGSLTNLYGAWELDHNFFIKLRQIVLMGGITEPLIINGKLLDELNFSCDPEASYMVLSSGAKVTVLTGNTCLQALFGENEYKRLRMENRGIFRYINEKTTPWFSFVMQEFGIKGFYNWDVVAAVYLTNPELFDDNPRRIASTPQELEQGRLIADDRSPGGYVVNVPRSIKDVARFNALIYEAWSQVKVEGL